MVQIGQRVLKGNIELLQNTESQDPFLFRVLTTANMRKNRVISVIAQNQPSVLIAGLQKLVLVFKEKEKNQDASRHFIYNEAPSPNEHILLSYFIYQKERYLRGENEFFLFNSQNI